MSRAALHEPRPAPSAPEPVETSPSPTPVSSRAAARGRVRSRLERPVVACLVLFAVYASLSCVVEAGGFVAADSGGKVATLHVMTDHGTLDPAVGYWAAAADPTGVLHPLSSTAPVGSEFVQVTTLPMLIAAVPLQALGGDRVILLLPMLGAVLCALAARALARRLGAPTGWAAFWVVGLATPVAIYAVSFWEHTLGLAAMLWAIVFLLDVVRRDAGLGGAAVVGILFGVAATMRTEALVYFVVAAACMCIAIVVRDRALTRAFAAGLCAGVGAVASLAAEYVVEVVLVGRGLRGSRAASTAAEAGASLLDRAHDAATTLVGLNGFKDAMDWFVGALIVAALAGGAWCLAKGEARRSLGLALVAIAAVLYALRFTAGLGFVPGLLTASPIAAVGALAIWRRATPRTLAAIAWLSLPAVWFAQYTGGASPQWGGRYLLLSGALFAVAAVVALARHRVALGAIVALSVVVTGFGFVYLADRSLSVDQGFAQILRRHDAALISLDPHLFREAGAFYDPTAHWLTATDAADLARAARIVRQAGDRELAVLVPEGEAIPAVEGFRRGASQSIVVRPDLTVRAVTYHTE